MGEATYTPGQRAATTIIDGPALDMLCGAAASQGLMGGKRDDAARQEAIDCLADLIDRETGVLALLKALQQLRAASPLQCETKELHDAWQAVNDAAALAAAGAAP